MPVAVSNNALLGWTRTTGRPGVRRQLAALVARSTDRRPLGDGRVLVNLGRAWGVLAGCTLTAVWPTGRARRGLASNAGGPSNPPPTHPHPGVICPGTAGHRANREGTPNENPGASAEIAGPDA